MADSAETLQRTPLHDAHQALGARMMAFGGFDMPVQYSGIIDEHMAVRTDAGLFDVSHMGEVLVRGPEAFAFVQNLVTNDAEKLYDGRAMYTVMCTPDGGIVDDLIVYRRAEDHYMLVVNAANRAKDWAWMQDHNPMGADLEDVGDDVALLALQGPKSLDIAQSFVDFDLSEIKFYHFREAPGSFLDCDPAIISRTGYTGERGYEIFCKALDTHTIWDTILEEGKSYGIIPCAFVTLDWLRVESYLLFYPFDMSEAYPIGDEPHGDSLWELGLDFTVSKTKNPMDFRGGLEHMRLKGKERFKIFGVLVEGDQPAGEGDEVWSGDKKVGVITCAMYSRLKQQSMALARLDVPYAEHGTPLEVRGSLNAKASAHTLPFDDPKKEKRAAKG